MKSEIQLKASHLIIPPDLANQVLAGYTSAYVAYQSEAQTVLLSSRENTWFPKMHESMELMLKSRDMTGTKSISIREILIDHELDAFDKMLSYTVNEERKFIKITWGKREDI